MPDINTVSDGGSHHSALPLIINNNSGILNGRRVSESNSEANNPPDFIRVVNDRGELVWVPAEVLRARRTDTVQPQSNFGNRLSHSSNFQIGSGGNVLSILDQGSIPQPSQDAINRIDLIRREVQEESFSDSEDESMTQPIFMSMNGNLNDAEEGSDSEKLVRHRPGR